MNAFLSQRTVQYKKLRPRAFFSHKLSPAERYYNIGNPKPLAVKLALEELRGWLDGAEQSFVVWTDHTDLEYIPTAERVIAPHHRPPPHTCRPVTTSP